MWEHEVTFIIPACHGAPWKSNSYPAQKAPAGPSGRREMCFNHQKYLKSCRICFFIILTAYKLWFTEPQTLKPHLEFILPRDIHRGSFHPVWLLTKVLPCWFLSVMKSGQEKAQHMELVQLWIFWSHHCNKWSSNPTEGWRCCCSHLLKEVFFFILEQIKSVTGAQQGLRAVCADRAGTGTGVEWDSLGSAGISSSGAGREGRAAAQSRRWSDPGAARSSLPLELVSRFSTEIDPEHVFGEQI